MKKMMSGLFVLVMLFAFSTSAFASNWEGEGTYSHSGGDLWISYSAYDSHVHGFLSVSVYKVTPSGDQLVTNFSIEGGRPGYDLHVGNWYLGNMTAGTYKYKYTMPSAWMGPYLSFNI